MCIPKFVIVTGGVLSGIGKGVLTASIGALLRFQHKVIPIKCDGYLNSDPGTMSPYEHGEVFVLDDGGEVDMDFGHYERFLNISAKRDWNITMGKVYKSILEKERVGKYLGKTAQLIPHVTGEIKEIILNLSHESSSDFVLIEIGGTVGDLENALFIESIRQMSSELGRDRFFFIHLTYVPIFGSEQKSKPTQQSVRTLNQAGIYPDLIMSRCEELLTTPTIEKISLFCNVPKECVIGYPTVKFVYEIPVYLKKSGLQNILSKKFSVSLNPDLSNFTKLIEASAINNSAINKNCIAILGKYGSSCEPYISLREAIFHASVGISSNKIDIEMVDIDNNDLSKIHEYDGLIIPGGFGSRGYEKKIRAIQIAREADIPLLGICLGMQLMVVEFSRNICGIHHACSEEYDIEERHTIDTNISTDFVVCLIASQDNEAGSMRCGSELIKLVPNTISQQIYGEDTIKRRFRHRYEVNPIYTKTLEEHGLIISAKDTKQRIPQMIEYPQNKFFIGCQFHPELTSKPGNPDPLFCAFLKNTTTH